MLNIKTALAVLSLGLVSMTAAQGASSTASSVDWPKTPRATTEFVQAMPSDAWRKVVSASVNLDFWVGRPVVAVYNPTSERITQVVCDDKWELVGANAYNKSKGAPAFIEPHKVTLIPTDSFDGWCKSSIVAKTASGNSYNGELSIKGDFTNSTSITFSVKSDGAATDGSDPIHWPTRPRDVANFVQDMPGDAWRRVMSSSLDLAFLVGRPYVAVFNSTDEKITGVLCDDKWYLVGAKSYNKGKGAPDVVNAHQVVFIPSDGFDGYCKGSIVAISESGERYDAELTIKGNFSDSTGLIIKDHD